MPALERLGGDIKHQGKLFLAIKEEIKKLLAFKKQVEVLAMKVAEKAELIDMRPVSDPQSQWYNKH